MRRVIRSFCVLFSVLFCLQIVPSREIVTEIEAETAYTYDPDKAVAWAKNANNFINGNYQCAHFVSYCLQHGGLTDVDFGYPHTLTAYVEKKQYGKKVNLTDENIANLKAGDFIVVFCDLHEDYYGIHTIFVTEVDHEQGYLRYSAKNEFRCNEVMTFQQLKNYSSYFSCLHHGNAKISTYIVSMYTSKQVEEKNTNAEMNDHIDNTVDQYDDIDKLTFLMDRSKGVQKPSTVKRAAKLHPTLLIRFELVKTVSACLLLFQM